MNPIEQCIADLEAKGNIFNTSLFSEESKANDRANLGVVLQSVVQATVFEEAAKMVREAYKKYLDFLKKS